jgi:TolB-like protein
MPGAHQDPTTPPHSVFISYASADRAVARTLRDTLTEAGLEVWLDEDELAGGEAWDAKIRNQIRTCSYFMPVISATTETRREGYFRREWRLAVERTLDFADDVMFLVPVVIDDTRDAGARVPEKFLAVQWLRVPGGQATPELRKLAARLAEGETEAAPEAPPAPVPEARGRKGRKVKAEPPPFPKFPSFPEHGHRARFIYDLVVWAGHLFLAFWGHLPRWLRVLAAVILIFNVISWFKNTEPPVRKGRSEVADEVKQMLDASGIKPSARDRERKKVGALESLVGGAVETIQAGRPVTVVPFEGEDKETRDYASEVFGAVCADLRDDNHQLWGISPLPFRPNATDADIVARGLKMKSRFVLTGRASVAAPGLASAFTVRLFNTHTGELVWKETYELTKHDGDDVGELVVAEIRKRLAAPAAPVPPPVPDK